MLLLESENLAMLLSVFYSHSMIDLLRCFALQCYFDTAFFLYTCNVWIKSIYHELKEFSLEWILTASEEQTKTLPNPTAIVMKVLIGSSLKPTDSGNCVSILMCNTMSKPWQMSGLCFIAFHFEKDLKIKK